MTHKYRDALDRLEALCETGQAHGDECFATKLLDIAVAYFIEQDIKNRCLSYPVATNQLRKFYETDIESLRQSSFEE